MTIGQIGIYLLEVSVLLILLYIFNKLLLARETLHRLNRALWLSTLVVAFAVPLCAGQSVRYAEVVMAEQPSEIFDAEAMVLFGDTANGASIVEIATNVLFWIYALGVAMLIAHTCFTYLSLLRLVLCSSYRIDSIRRAQFKEYEREVGVQHNIRYVVHNRDLSPFSWLHFVVISEDDLCENGREIIIHELSHIKQHHSLDVSILNIVTIILWFNPAAWLTKSALQQVHEYCADESVIEAGVNAKEYQLLLIRKAVGARLYSMSNSLNHSNLKNRITMMLQKKSNKMAAAKCLYAIPLVILAIALFTSPALADSTSAISEVKITNYLVNNQIDDQKVELNESGGSSHGADTKPYIVVNDKLAPDADINSIDPNKIESVSIVKDVNSSEFKRYNIDGDRSVGLVIIELKEGETLESARISAAS
ncbi:MAG: M56 family metallopeptidase [Rikenellaceae bacterium]